MNPQWEKEVIAAAKWWADQLDAKSNHDNGDKGQSKLANYYASRLEPITEEQYCDFRESLQEEIESMLTERKNWRPEDPHWGSSNRVISTDYNPDKFLTNAALYAGITDVSLRLPIKTIMWINPGEVKVSCGYRAPVETIYKC